MLADKRSFKTDSPRNGNFLRDTFSRSFVQPLRGYVQMIRTYEFKLYPNQAQIKTLQRWMSTCCWIFNRCLEHRIKAYKRRGQSIQYNEQQAMLVEWRSRIECLKSVPSGFERDALRRVDRGFKAFFRCLKAGQTPGFPRFKSWRHYNSLEYAALGNYFDSGKIRIPCLGVIRARGRTLPVGKQKILRIIRRPTGWYAQIVLDDCLVAPETRPVETSVGIDVGLTSIVALSTGETVPNPRWLKKSTHKLRSLQRRVSRRVKGSANRREAGQCLARKHEQVANQRRGFCHELTTRIIREFDLIAVEKLLIVNMIRSKFSKGILDAAWGLIRAQLSYKAANAGKTFVEVNPRGTSQECPECGRIVKKELSERVHKCPCGCVGDRDVIASRVVVARALAGKRGKSLVEESANVLCHVGADQVDPVKREDCTW